MPGPPAAAAAPRAGPARGGGGRAAAAAWRLQVQQARRQPPAHVTNAAAGVIVGAGPGRRCSVGGARQRRCGVPASGRVCWPPPPRGAPERAGVPERVPSSELFNC